MFSVDPYSLGLAVPAVVFLAHFVPWLVDSHGIRSYPGPFFAKFSNIWLAYISKNGHRSETLHKVHQKYGISYFNFAPSWLTLP
jgi:benzoate 4-monooxygenase